MPYNTVWPGHQRPMDQSEVASFLSFEMSEPVTVRLVASRDFDDLSIRPLSKGVQARVHGREIEFSLTQCGSYTVELDGWHNALHIFANPVCDFGVTDKSAPGVRYFGPGIHEVGDLELSNGETLFVDGGAVLYGSVTAIHKKNVRVVGYGVIDGSREVRDNTTSLITWGVGKDLDLPASEATLRAHLKEENVLHGCVHFYSCQDSEIAGVIARDSATFAFILADCERVNCERAKTIGMWRYNSDGVDLFNSRYVRIADCFLRNFDDCIVLKGIKGWDRENLHHIIVSGCTVWCDWGSALEVGAETCADEYYDIVWENCDVIHASLAYMRTHNSIGPTCTTWCCAISAASTAGTTCCPSIRATCAAPSTVRPFMANRGSSSPPSMTARSPTTIFSAAPATCAMRTSPSTRRRTCPRRAAALTARTPSASPAATIRSTATAILCWKISSATAAA